MTRDANLRQHALELLEQSKKFLQEDGDLDPTAFIIAGRDQLLRPIDLQDEVSKTKSCKKILAEARKLHALAIITIFIARSKSFDREEFAEEIYSWGDLREEGSERCILVTLSGPGVRNWAVALPFEGRGKKMSFGKQVEFSEGVDIGLFPGWSDQIKA
jgi:hypothetical protein